MDKGIVSTGRQMWFTSNAIVTRFWAPMDKYVAVETAWACVECGFVEMYVDAAELRRRLKRWKRR